jgi:hypothetical protein
LIPGDSGKYQMVSFLPGFTYIAHFQQNGKISKITGDYSMGQHGRRTRHVDNRHFSLLQVKACKIQRIIIMTAKI